MRAKKLLAIGVTGTLGAVLALPASAQMRGSETLLPVSVVSGMASAGPTRVFTVPQANVLGLGNNLISTSIFLGATAATPIGGQPAVGFGIANNALNLRAQMGMADNFELGTGIGYIAGTPWQGQLDVTGKWALMSEGMGALASVAGLAGGVLSVDANGQPALGLQLGVPISKFFAFNDINFLNLTLYPNYNFGILQPAAILPGGAQPSNLNFFALGIGGAIGMNERIHLLADTNLGMPVGGINTQSNLGVRYVVTRDFVGDLFVGFNPGPNLGFGQAPGSVGLGAHWRF
jgi:hypothetical protein